MRPEAIKFDRRTLMLTGAGLAFACPTFAGTSPFAAIEQRAKGRLGIMVLDVESGRRLTYRADERFPMCSTFKLLLAAYVLARVDAGRETLDRRLTYAATDLLEYAPITRAHVADGAMTVGDLCAAAVELSDNTAANLLLKEIGGPAALTAWLRKIGDPTTRLDHIEPAMNLWAPGQVSDTTSPAAVIATWRKLLLGETLSPPSRTRLIGWLQGSTTGARRLRAGLPDAWRAGDKTGTWSDDVKGTANDIAILWPTKGGPILAAALLCDAKVPSAQREAALADVGRVIAREFTNRG